MKFQKVESSLTEGGQWFIDWNLETYNIDIST